MHNGKNFFTRRCIFNAARTIVLRGTNVDHGIKFYKTISVLLGIKIDTPKILLARTLFQKKRFFIGVQFSPDSHDVPFSGVPAGVGQLYVESGALKYRGSSGTVTTIANA